MVIACIDFSNNGHRLHLMRSVIKSVLETGNTAICITNETDSIKDWIQENSGILDLSNLGMIKILLIVFMMQMNVRRARSCPL